MTTRVTVDLPTAAVSALSELSKKRGVTRTDVLVHAISLEQQIEQELDQGAKILIQKAGGLYKELQVSQSS